SGHVALKEHLLMLRQQTNDVRRHAKPSIGLHRRGVRSGVPVWLPDRPHLRFRGSPLAREGRLARASALLLMHGQRSTTMRDGQLRSPAAMTNHVGTNAKVLIEWIAAVGIVVADEVGSVLPAVGNA